MRFGYFAAFMLVVLCLAGNGIQAQRADTTGIYPAPETGARTDEVAWMRYAVKHAKFSPQASDTIQPGFYTVKIKFIVQRDSTASDAKVACDPGYGFGAAALQVFNGYKGKWIPAMQGGRTVKSYKTVSLRFDIRPVE